MQSFTVSDLDELIKQTLSSDKNIGKLLIGYKLFAELMNDSKFSDEVNHSALSSNLIRQMLYGRLGQKGNTVQKLLWERLLGLVGRQYIGT